jgi:hypothetical protein
MSLTFPAQMLPEGDHVYCQKSTSRKSAFDEEIGKKRKLPKK